MMEFLSEKLVSSGYRDRLNADLRRADLCRFLVAYVSEDGLNAIGRSELIHTLRHPDSFGISSLSCSCAFTPLLRLQRAIGGADVRLKYFMDPMVKRTDEPDGIALFHSKLVYLRLPRESKSIVYLGSHNWTGRALGPSRPRNVEASLRLELEYGPEHLTGGDDSIASQVNRHLLGAYQKPLCLPATPNNESVFEQWFAKGCCNAPQSPLEQIAVILAVRNGSTSASPAQWSRLTRQGIYLQALEESEGKLIRRASDRILLMVWDSRAYLEAGIPPVLLRCRVSTQKAGLTSELRGTNQAEEPVKGFGAAVYDESQLAAMQQGSRGQRSALSIWSGREVELYDFEFRQAPTSSAQIDGGVQPKYQFHLEVDHVVFPADRDAPDDPAMLWTPVSFAVAKSKDDARLERIEGYYVPAELRVQIMMCLTEELMVDPHHAKVLPVSEYDRGKEGKRISDHPLHETFLGKTLKEGPEEFYERAKRGVLVANIDDHLSVAAPTEELIREIVPRVQRVFTMKLRSLEQEWASIASEIRKTKQRGKHHE